MPDWRHSLRGTGLAGGSGRVLAADIWLFRKRGVRLPWLLAGVPGLRAGDADYWPAALAPLGPNLPDPGFLKK